MAAKCPSCSAAIESLPGFIAQETHEDRLKNQKAGLLTESAAIKTERDLLKTALAETQAKASGFDAVAAERDKLRGDLAAHQQRTERTAALAAHKVPDAMLPHFELVYNAAVAGQETPTPFAEWMAAAENGAKAHPLLTPHFTPSAPGAPPTPPNGLPDPAAGAGRPPPLPGAKLTEADVAAWMRSPAYLALPIPDRIKALDAKEAEVAAQHAQNTA